MDNSKQPEGGDSIKYFKSIGYNKWLPISKSEFNRQMRLIRTHNASLYLLAEIKGKVGIHISTGVYRKTKTIRIINPTKP